MVIDKTVRALIRCTDRPALDKGFYQKSMNLNLHREQSKCNQDKKRTGTIIQWYAQAFVFSGGLTGLSIMPLPPSRKVFQDDLGKKKGRPSSRREKKKIQRITHKRNRGREKERKKGGWLAPWYLGKVERSTKKRQAEKRQKQDEEAFVAQLPSIAFHIEAC